MRNNLFDPFKVLVKVLWNTYSVADVISFKQLLDVSPLFFTQTQNRIRYSDYGRHDRVLVRLFLASHVQLNISYALKMIAVRTIQQKVREHVNGIVGQRYS